MQRLTERADEYFHKSGIIYYPKDKGLNKAICNKLGEYEDLEEQGLLLRLPVKIGDTVYTNTRVVGWHLANEKRPYEVNVAFIGINEKFAFMNVVYKNNGVFQFEFSEIGKTVFLTKEEAEAKLREMEE